ncbi:MAG: acyl--CoA ligase [Clostridiales bacterium]|nr:acyl--CoA ligase [Clostridiales bacterium]
MWKSIEEYVFDHAYHTPDKKALITRTREVTYRELVQEVKGCVAFLQAKGVSKGSVVVVKTSQTIEHIVLYLAIHMAGGVMASLERTISNEGIVNAAASVGASVIISDDPAVTELYQSVFIDSREISGLFSVRKCDGSASDDLENEDGEDSAESLDYVCENGDSMKDSAGKLQLGWTFPKAEDPGEILFTTGTTGKSKGVEMSHGALFALAENLTYGVSCPTDFVLVIPGPLNHANAIRNLTCALVNGGACYLLNGMMNLQNFFEALEYPCDKISCVLPPAYIRMIFMLSQDKIGEYADRIDYIMSSTSPIPEADKERLCRLLPNSRLYNSYGSSESGMICMYDYNANPGLKNCIGRETKNSEVLIVDEEGKEIASSPDHTGLIACKSATNMIGYVNEPEMTEQHLRNGIFYTNDIGYKDENGFIYILGRKGDVINVGGMKVAPSEVEEAAIAYDGVEDCICVAVDDGITEKALKLLVVMREGQTLNKKEIRQFLADRLEAYKVPPRYEQVGQIRRTYNGKLDRKAYA